MPFESSFKSSVPHPPRCNTARDRGNTFPFSFGSLLAVRLSSFSCVNRSSSRLSIWSIWCISEGIKNKWIEWQKGRLYFIKITRAHGQRSSYGQKAFFALKFKPLHTLESASYDFRMIPTAMARRATETMWRRAKSVVTLTPFSRARDCIWSKEGEISDQHSSSFSRLLLCTARVGKRSSSNERGPLVCRDLR